MYVCMHAEDFEMHLTYSCICVWIWFIHLFSLNFSIYDIYKEDHTSLAIYICECVLDMVYSFFSQFDFYNDLVQFQLS